MNADVPLRETHRAAWASPKGGAFELVCEEARFVVTDALVWRAIGAPAPRRCLAARVPAGRLALRQRVLK